MMRPETIAEAIAEARRFILAAKRLQAAQEAQQGKPYKSALPREAGAVRRASMDLTRKLADLRQGR